MYSIRDLGAIELRNDKLEDFLNLWDRCLMQMAIRPDKEQILVIYFYDQVSKATCLKEHIKIYDHMDDDDPKKANGAGYDWLYNVARKELSICLLYTSPSPRDS